jgi:phage shock protein E
MRYGKIKLMKCLHGMKKILLTLMVFGSFGVFAVDKLETTQASNPILIDVRTDAEWNDGYIETAIHIPLDKILQKIEFATESKDQAIYLYCRSGKRSAKAEKALQSIGYINAKNIGGMKQASSSLQLQITNE